MDYLCRKWISRFKPYGITEEDIESRRKKFGPNSDRDMIWSLFNEIIPKIEDYHELSMQYYHMALFLDEEEKDPFPMLEESSKMRLMHYKNRGTPEIRISGNGCPSCQELHNKIYSVDEALKEMPLPNKNCTRTLNGKYGFCRCCYSPNVLNMG